MTNAIWYYLSMVLSLVDSIKLWWIEGWSGNITATTRRSIAKYENKYP